MFQEIFTSASNLCVLRYDAFVLMKRAIDCRPKQNITRIMIFSLVILYYYTLYSLSVFSLAKSLQLILEISANYRLVSYLLGDN